MKFGRLFSAFAIAAILFAACEKDKGGNSSQNSSTGKDGGITYQLLVYSFADAAFGDN